MARQEAPEDLELPDTPPSGEATSRLQDDLAAAVGAQADQTKAGMVINGYYVSLEEAGFTKEQALHLAANYQSVMLTIALNRKGQSA